MATSPQRPRFLKCATNYDQQINGQPEGAKLRLLCMTRILFFSFFVLTGLSCSKGPELLPGFDMLYQQNFIIPVGISQFEVHHFQFENVNSRYQQYLDQHKKTDAEITSIVTGKAAITGIFGDANLDFIDQVSIRVYDQSDPNDYIEIAYRFPVPLDPGNNLPVIPSLADAKRFLKNSRFALDVVIWLRKPTTQESEVRFDLEMRATL